MAEQKHSRAYHRYFEDYAERQVVGPDGAVHTERVYVGKFYKVNCSDDALRRQRIGLCGLYLLAAAALILGGIFTPVSSLGIVAILTMAALISILVLAVPVFYRLTVPREMEIRAWRDSSENLKRNSLGAAICLLLCAIVSFLAAALLSAYSLRDSVGAVLYVLSGDLCLAIHILEKRTEYEILPPKNERPSMSSPIRYYSSD